MASISGIKVTVKKIKDIIDQSHYTQLNNELKNVIEQSTALDEYINLLTISKLYLSNVKDVVNQLYSLTGDNSAFKAKVAQLSSNKTFEYDVIPENSTKQKKVITYTYFDTFSFDIILSVLRTVSLAQQTKNSQFFLPISPNSVNQIAQNVTTNYVAAILQERVEIDKHLKNIKSNASKLTVNSSQNTTPTAVANNSIKEVEELIKKICDLNTLWANTNSSDFVLARDTVINDKKTFCNAPNETNARTYINSAKNYIKEAKAFINSPLFKLGNFIDFTQDQAKDYRDSITEIESKIQDLNKFISYKKKTSTDVLVNDTKLQTATEKSTTPPQTTPTTDKPTAAIPNTSLPLTPDTWGIKFTTNRQASSEDIRFLATADKGTVTDTTFYMDLLPARQSTIPVQGGRDVPNAMPGLNYKLITQVGKQAIPGFSPVYQNLGIKGMQVTIVGAFTGGDGSESTRKTDTPEAKSKTPWLNSKGSPSLSDNPDRGGKLSELTAYNSYTEFVQLCQQGKHMEVEINLFQVYNQSTTTQIGQDIKLQSKNGNPKFTGIVRSLDVYHATKERTWYTLIMDVTDFGMASKKAINLNNKLQAAIKKAQDELEAAQAAEAAKEANPTSEITETTLDQINKSNLSEEDKVKYRKKLAWFAFLSKEALANNYVDGSRLEPLMSELQSNRKDNISYIQAIALSNDRVLVKIANKCTFTEEYRKILFLQQNLTLAKLTSSIMSGFIKFSIEKNNRDIFKCENISYFLFGKDVILKEYLMSSNDPTPFKNDSRLTSTSLSELNSLIAQRLNNISGPEIIAIFGKATGCLTAAGLGGAILGGLVGLGTAAVGCINQAGDNVYKAYLNNDPNTQDYNYVKGELFSGDSIREWVTTFVTTLTIDAVTAGVGSKLTGGGFRQGISQAYKQGVVYKGGSLLKGKPSSISTSNGSTVSASFIENLNKIPDIENKLIGQTITFNGQQGVIQSLAKNTDGTLTGNAVIKYNNGQTAFVNLNFADSLPNVNLPTQPKVTTNPTNSTSATQSQAAVNTIDDAIKNSKYTNTLKTYLLSLPDSQKTQAIKSLNEVDILNPNQILEIKLKNGGVVTFDGADVTSDGIIYNRTNRVSVADIESSSLKSKITTTSQSTPPPIASLDAAITKLPSKYADNAAKAAIENLPEIQQKKIINLINDIEANGLDNIEFSIKNSKIQTKVNSIKVTANGDIEITTSRASLPVNPSDLSYKKITPPPKSPTTTVPESQSTTPSSTPEVSQPNPVPPSVPPNLTSYAEVGLYTEIKSYLGKQLGSNSYLKLKISSGKVYNVQQLDFDSKTNEYIVKYFSASGNNKSGTIRIKSDNIDNIKDFNNNYVTKIYKIKDGLSIDNEKDIDYFFKNLSNSEQVILPLDNNQEVLIKDVKFVFPKDIPYLQNPSLNYKLKYKTHTGEIIEVNIYRSQFNVYKTSKSTFPDFREIPAPLTPTTLAPGHSKIITDKAEMITYLQNFPENTLIPFNFLENPGLRKLMNFNEWSNNPPDIFFKLKKVDSSNYLVEFADEKTRVGGNRIVLPLENFVKFINGFSAK